jgi:hypothetical protein
VMEKRATIHRREGGERRRGAEQVGKTNLREAGGVKGDCGAEGAEQRVARGSAGLTLRGRDV